MLTETLVTALPAGITALGEAGELGSAGSDMTEAARQMLQLSLVTLLYSVNTHSSVLQALLKQEGKILLCTSAM